jgi:hypothetical protein
MKTKNQPQKAPAEIPCSAGKLKKTKKTKSFVYYREGAFPLPLDRIGKIDVLLSASPPRKTGYTVDSHLPGT